MSRPLHSIDSSATEEDFEKFLVSLRRKVEEVTQEARFLEKVDKSRLTNLRFSSLPFCGLKWFLNLPKSMMGDGEKVVDFSYKYFTSVGHTVHDVFQTAMHNYSGVTMLDDYVCRKCKHRVYLSGKVVEECPKCGHDGMKRNEHEIAWMGALGHIDNILQVQKKGPRRSVFVLDYKTTSMKAIESKEDPPGYLAQLSSYATGVSYYKNVDVVGYGLVYVPRDNPFQFRISSYRFTEESKKRGTARMKKWVRDFEIAATVKDLKGALALIDNRPCKEKAGFMFSECEFVGQCAGCGSRPESMEFLVMSTFKKISHVLPIKAIG